MVQDPDNLSQFLSYGPQINELEEKNGTNFLITLLGTPAGYDSIK